VENLIPVNYDSEQPTVSARELHEGLEIGTKFATWFPRMAEYGFAENIDYKICYPNMGSENHGGQNMVDYQISVDMAKQICMIQRSEKGRLYRQYFLDLEKAWNTPEQVFARALRMADKTIESLKADNTVLLESVERMRPKEVFADAVSGSQTSILVGELAKLLKQNDIEIGQRRLFSWMRENGFLVKRGSSMNMPTQKGMELGLFEIKEGSYINGVGENIITKTTKVTGKGQQYFINKFLQCQELTKREG
jgi:anti-repressor protein